ncbi:zinc-binding dehydrogenase [Psittacicella hinzii]|uniref:Zinc-binding dehydrogenase n=1 Tax=Psittacicella hinzii TaxID=2028575 RepID=A0A3A1Y484_9GAMM|nr:NAD(P)-dependent alcohol dehydrogenase [Psittacicella hinzii]RIY32066.1 zinc-binding dehydrogenase [Psittacicella hinzii]
MSLTTHTVAALGVKGAKEKFEQFNVERRDVRENDIEFEVLYCGICHSDLHTVLGEFPIGATPVVPGHEIVGRVTKVGAKVTSFKVGDLAAVGCIVDSCNHCPACHEHEEQFCDEKTFSFNSPDKVLGDGAYTLGGFSKSYVVEEKYALHMPAFKDLASAAPLLCAGITVYSPLKYWQTGPGKKVAILGIGGLGHVAVRFAKAMGAEVTVITRTQAKAEDAKRLGADYAIVSTDAEQMAAARGKFNLILDTISAPHDVNEYLNLLYHRGALVTVGLPHGNYEVAPFAIVSGNKVFAGSNIGGIAETQEMLDFAYKHNIVADVEVIDPDYLDQAFTRLENNDVRYRFVLDLQKL